MIFPIQIQAARILVGLSQQELAKRAAVGLGTIKRIEAARLNLTGTAQILSRIQLALETAGVVFIEEDRDHGPGVRLAKPLLKKSK